MNKIFQKLIQYLTTRYGKFQDRQLLKELLADIDEQHKKYTTDLLSNELRWLNSEVSEKLTFFHKRMFMRVAKEVILDTMPLRNIVGIQPSII